MFHRSAFHSSKFDVLTDLLAAGPIYVSPRGWTYLLPAAGSLPIVRQLQLERYTFQPTT